MPEVWQIAQWLRDGGDDDAAAVIEQCVVEFEYIDTAFELSGDREFDLYEAIVRGPRRVIAHDADSSVAKAIDGALRSCAEADGLYIRDVRWAALLPTIQHSPSADSIATALDVLEDSHLREAWEKALSRKSSDPEGAITAARTLLESVCKSILDACGSDYDDKADLPKLYNATAQILRLAPGQHTEEVFRQILGGCFAVVNGLGTVRNRLSDAHGKGRRPVRPEARHAELAVNLSGAVAMFLAATFQARRAAEPNVAADTGPE